MTHERRRMNPKLKSLQMSFSSARIEEVNPR
jgi:hypothetical protein